MPSGVPTFAKFDAKKRTKYLDLIATGQNKGLASKACGVSRYFVYMYRIAHPEFADLESQAEMDANGVIENALFQTAAAGNTTAQQVWLYNRASDRWQDKRNLELTGKDGGPIKVIERVERARADEGNRISALGETGSIPGCNGAH